MKPPRFSIAGLLGLVLFCAVAFAALRDPTVFWAQVTTSLTLVALIAATLGALIRARPDRARFLGFAVAGWIYATLALGPWFGEHVAPLLLTTRVLDELFLRVPSIDGKVYVALNAPGPLGGPAYDLYLDHGFIRFHLIGHALFSVLAGWAGSVLAVLLATREQPDPRRLEERRDAAISS
ncbi:MAG TPA: hypothetical protein VGZ22_25670 [Isosphaeraceae bacterium]|jgi:hypothetical protein|nr:hypothetical protein [Isosphaeraceae bacterium]